MVHGEFQFPLAQGDLQQPGMTERKVRHRKIKKQRIDELKEEEAEQKSQQTDAGGNPTPREVLDMPTTEADVWTCNSNVLIRHHRTPRTKLYVPTEEESPISFKFIEILRKTITNLEHLQESEFHDIWIGAESGNGFFDKLGKVDRCLSNSWTGRTTFTILKKTPKQGFSYQSGRLTKIQANSTRPPSVYLEEWGRLSKNNQLQEIEKWA